MFFAQEKENNNKFHKIRKKVCLDFLSENFGLLIKLNIKEIPITPGVNIYSVLWNLETVSKLRQYVFSWELQNLMKKFHAFPPFTLIIRAVHEAEKTRVRKKQHSESSTICSTFYITRNIQAHFSEWCVSRISSCNNPHSGKVWMERSLASLTAERVLHGWASELRTAGSIQALSLRSSIRASTNLYVTDVTAKAVTHPQTGSIYKIHHIHGSD